jgi:3-oxoisoapionate decarboxylase
MINRREFVAHLASAAFVAGTVPSLADDAPSRRSKMGLVTYVFNLHQDAARTDKTLSDLSDPLNFLEECYRLGAGGVQVPLGVKDKSYLDNLRRKAQQYEMQVQTTLALPKNEEELDGFEQQIITARNAGAAVARVVMLPGRRYEQFDTRADYERACEQGLKSLRLAEPIAARHHVQLAVENHKDHLAAEKLEVLRQISSEYVGLCVDVSNNFALLEDPLETARLFAPYALSVHIKDQGIKECADGFLLSDEPLGTGFLDLPALVATLRQAKPKVPFYLEVITRDPIKVAVRSDKYWATFPGRPRSAMEPMLKLAREKEAAKPQVLVSQLPRAQQLALERRNIKLSLDYARDKLGL